MYSDTELRMTVLLIENDIQIDLRLSVTLKSRLTVTLNLRVVQK